MLVTFAYYHCLLNTSVVTVFPKQQCTKVYALSLVSLTDGYTYVHMDTLHKQIDRINCLTVCSLLHSTNFSSALAFLCCLDIEAATADTISAETKVSVTH